MTNVIERLRASKEEADRQWFSKGRMYGESWAKNYATYDELVRVVAVRDDEDHPWEVDERSPYSAAEILFFAIDGQEYRDRGDARDFWVSAIDEETEPLQHAEFLRGFAEGAAHLYESIEDEL